MAAYLLRYGRGALEVKLPEGLDLHCLTGKPLPALDSVAWQLRRGLADPFGCAPLKRQARDKGSALIVVGDHTRYNAYERWLPTLLDELNAVGIPDAEISIYVGSGTHRPMTAEEKREYFGEEACSRVEVLDHDCDAMARMKKVGRTDYGTTIYVDQRVFDAELLIITGGIKFHYFAGYSGGRKALLPGCCARETILSNHRHTLDQRSGDFNPAAAPGRLVGNPVNEDMLLVANQLSPDLCINVLLNEEREIAWLGVGDHGYVLRRGAKFLNEHSMIEVGRLADIAIIGAGGHPKDLTLFQAHKSVRHSMEVLRPGALVFWLAKCEQGQGVEEFRGFASMSLEECMVRVQERISLSSFCALSLKKIADMYDVHLISDLPPADVRAWGFTPHQEIHQALAASLPARAHQLRWLVAPDMSNLLPVRPGTRYHEEHEDD